jgi:uncharacterized protein (DUF1800 family)
METTRKPELLIVTGMSGAGRSTVGNALEDQGWYVIDNLPPQLLGPISDLFSLEGPLAAHAPGYRVRAAQIALAQAAGKDFNTLLAEQLAPGPAPLPAAAQAQIDALTLSQQGFTPLMFDLEQRRRAADALKNDDEKRAAQQAYQQELTRLAREAASRHLLRALYSPRQVQEQMTWFWLNHFSVFQNKANIRAMVGDYEDTAIRPHALGRFRDLLGAAALHPAMLRYLDNEQNALNRGNENLARELMELHGDAIEIDV